MIKVILSSESRATAANAVEYALAPNILFLVALDDTGRLFDLDGNFYAVTTTGAQMLRETLEHGTAMTAQRIASQYGVDTQRVQSDLEIFLQELQRHRLLRHSTSERSCSPPRRPAATLSPLLFAPALHLVHRGFHSLKTRTWALLILARLSLGLFGWNQTVATWLQCHPMVGKHWPASEKETVQAIEETVRAVTAAYVFGVSCKERSLCCWALLRAAQVPAALVLGINLFPLASHCWCEVGSTIVTDFPDRCAQFTPVLRYV
jgi:hypothetical protein